MQVVVDTLPSFLYLIPVVMLFRVSDFSAMIAIGADRLNRCMGAANEAGAGD